MTLSSSYLETGDIVLAKTKDMKCLGEIIYLAGMIRIQCVCKEYGYIHSCNICNNERHIIFEGNCTLMKKTISKERLLKIKATNNTSLDFDKIKKIILNIQSTEHIPYPDCLYISNEQMIKILQELYKEL